MKSLYYIYHAPLAPAELLAIHQSPAVYGTALLFVEGIESVTGVAPALVHSIAAFGLNHPYVEGEFGLTSEQLIAAATELFTIASPTGVEVQVTKAQANHIKEIMFPPTEEVE
jgi:hypothetical protein